MVSSAPGSLPWFGSVRPNAPSSSPRAIPGRYRSFCSAVPNSWMPPITSDDCTDMPDRYPLSTRSTARVISPDATVDAPAHP